MADANLPAIGLVTTLQNKVGTSLTGIQNLLPPPEANAAMVQAGSSAMSTSVLLGIKNDTEQMLDVSRNTAQYLKEMLGLDEEALRKARENKAEALREAKNGTPVGVPGGVNLDVPNLDEKKGFDLGGITEGLTNVLTLGLGAKLASSIAAAGGGKALAQSLGKKLVKGGIYGVVAGAVAGPAIQYLDNEFKMDLDEDSKKDISNAITGVAAGAAIGGIPGAIIGGTLPFIANVGQYIAGEMDATKVKDYNFAAVGLGGSATAMFAAVKAAPLLAGSSFPAVAGLGAALGTLPFILAVGAGVAVGAGALYLKKKVDEFQELTFKKLEQTTKNIEKDMGMWAAQQEEGLAERFGFNVGSNLSELGKASVSALEAKEQFEQGTFDEKEQADVKGLATATVGMSDEALMEIFKDRTKTNNLFDVVESIKNIAVKGGFGKDSKMIAEQMFGFSDRLQGIIVKMQNNKAEFGRPVYDATSFARFEGNALERVSGVQDSIAAKEQKIAGLQRELTMLKQDPEGNLREIRRIESEIGGQRRLLNNLQDDRENMTSGRIDYNFSDLEKLYANDPEGLKKIVQMSLQNTGAQFIQQQNQNTKMKEEAKESVNINSVDARKTEVNRSTKQENVYTGGGGNINPTDNTKDYMLGASHNPENPFI